MRASSGTSCWFAGSCFAACVPGSCCVAAGVQCGQGGERVAAHLSCKAPTLVARIQTRQLLTQAHMYDDGLAGGVVDVNFPGRRDVQVPQVALQLRVGGLQVKKGLRDCKANREMLATAMQPVQHAPAGRVCCPHVSVQAAGNNNRAQPGQCMTSTAAAALFAPLCTCTPGPRTPQTHRAPGLSP